MKKPPRLPKYKIRQILRNRRYPTKWTTEKIDGEIIKYKIKSRVITRLERKKLRQSLKDFILI